MIAEPFTCVLAAAVLAADPAPAAAGSESGKGWASESGEAGVLDSLKISEDSTWGHIGLIDGLVVVRELKGCAAYHWMEPRPAEKDPPRRRI